MPNEVDLLAQYQSEDEKPRETALAALEQEIDQHLRDRKAALNEHDLNNVVQHAIERLELEPADFTTWTELLAKAKELAEAIAAEEIEWLKIFPDLHEETVRILRVKFGAMAEDDLVSIANKAFMKVREKYPKLIKDPKQVKNLLFDVARNAAKDELKARTAGIRDEGKLQYFEDMTASHGDEGDEDAPKFEPVDPNRDPRELLMAKEKKRTLWQAIARMPRKYAQIFLDLHLRGLKQSEVAKKHGLKIGSIGVYNQRAIQILGVLLAGTLGVLMVMWNWTTWFGNQIQVAMLDTNRGAAVPLKIEATRGAAAMLSPNEKVTDEVKLANEFKNSLESDSYLLFSATSQLQNWYGNWLPDSSKAQFKVIYDRNAHSIHLIGYWDKAIRLDETIPVTNEANMNEILNTVRDHINKASKR